jgi:hypothetical protein
LVDDRRGVSNRLLYHSAKTLEWMDKKDRFTGPFIGILVSYSMDFYFFTMFNSLVLSGTTQQDFNEPYLALKESSRSWVKIKYLKGEKVFKLSTEIVRGIEKERFNSRLAVLG